MTYPRRAPWLLTLMAGINTGMSRVFGVRGLVMGMVRGRGVAGPTVLLHDTFTDPNGTNLATHVMDVGSGWTLNAGTWQIQSNGCRKTASGSVFESTMADAGLADVTLSALVVNAINGGGVAGRITDNDNLWLIRHQTTNLQIFEKNAGAFTMRADVAGAVVAPYTIVVTFVGASISADIGAVHASYGLASFNQSATNFGFLAFGTNEDFDDFEVTA